MKRRFHLFVDAQDSDEPGSRYFASYEAAKKAAEAYPEKWRRFAWIMEHDPQLRWILRMRDGREVR